MCICTFQVADEPIPHRLVSVPWFQTTLCKLHELASTVIRMPKPRGHFFPQGVLAFAGCLPSKFVNPSLPSWQKTWTQTHPKTSIGTSYRYGFSGQGIIGLCPKFPRQCPPPNGDTAGYTLINCSLLQGRKLASTEWACKSEFAVHKAC